MKLEQFRWTETKGWEPAAPGKLDQAQLVLMFSSRQLMKEQKYLAEMKKAYPKAHFMGCSTAGEIYGTQVSDESLVVTAVQFERTTLKGAHTKVHTMGGSFAAGERLAKELNTPDLARVSVLSDGSGVNGSDLVAGLAKHLPADVTITGGLAGDGPRFEETYVLWDDAPDKLVVAALGFYGDRLKVGYGSLGGWDSFGPERLITKSKGNVLFELDGKSALELYKQYLGEHAQGLPATGLLFPLSLRVAEDDTPVVRTILAVSEPEQSMTFAGDVPEGSYARLMKANFDRLVDGAIGAAQTTYQAVGSATPDLAILISCVGRKLILKQRVEEEVEGVREVLGEQAVLAGFYSYGEISPFTPGAKCELHNQTMTITTFSED